MSKRDNFDVRPELVIGPAILNADNTPASIDLVDCNSAEIDILAGIGGITFSGTNKVEVKISHSDDNSSFTDVGAADVILGTNADASVGAGGIVKSFVAAHAAPSLSRVNYVGGRRWIRVLLDFSGTHGTGTAFSIVITKSRLALTGKTQS